MSGHEAALEPRESMDFDVVIVGAGPPASPPPSG